MSRSFLLFGFILYSVFLSSLANASDIDLSAPMDKGGWKLIWSEEFDYTGFPDSTKWSYDTEGNVYQWGNNEAQYYTSGRKENAWVSDGVLRITALKEPMEGRSYTSARLITKGKGDWLYGRKYMGTFRTTFIINEEGVIERIITPKEVKTKDHAAQIL